jgi:glycosyltransferase involved in cell wall biosynthesis
MSHIESTNREQTHVPELSLVVPVYNEERNVPEFLRRVIPIVERVVRDYEIIFAVDPGTDATVEIIEAARHDNSSIKMLEFSRRFGQPMATLAGLDHALGEAVIIMDVDLQDPPELIEALVEQWRSGFDVVVAQRSSRRGETMIKKVVAKVGYAVINRFSEVPIPRDTGDFRLLDRRAVDELKRFPETNGFLRGLVALVGFRQTAVMFDRPERFSGEGNYNRFFGSLRIGFNGVFAFSNAMLNIATVLGFAAAGLSFVGGATYVGLKIAGVDFPVGNPTIVFLILFVGGLQLICMGIIGQYIGRIYEEVRGRPRYIVAKTFGIPAAGSGRHHERR